MRNDLELLAPAGDWERLEMALRYGADAVYLAGKEFGLRAAAGNFNNEALVKAIELAHGMGKKVYVTCNTLPREDELNRLPVDEYRILDRGRLFVSHYNNAPKPEEDETGEDGIE